MSGEVGVSGICRQIAQWIEGWDAHPPRNARSAIHCAVVPVLRARTWPSE